MTEQAAVHDQRLARDVGGVVRGEKRDRCSHFFGRSLAVTANRRLASLLGVIVGSALQQIREVDFINKGQTIVLSTEWHVPGVFELRVNRRPRASDPGENVVRMWRR